MKKILSVILAATLCCGVMAGCGKKGADGNGTTTVRVWTNDAGGKAVWEELVNEFNEGEGKKKGVQIEWTTYASDYATTVDVARQNNQLPEILVLSSAQEDEFISTNDVIAVSDIEGGKEFLEKYDFPIVNNLNARGDKVYTAVSTSNVAGLIYNKDLFKKAGIVDEKGEAKPPVTLDEMVEDAKKITNAEETIYGYSYPMAFDMGYTITTPFSASYKSKVDADKKTVDVTELKPILEALLQMKKDESLFPGAENLDNDTSRAYFAEGKIGMMAGISWDVGVLTSQFVAKCDWGVAPYPTVDGTSKYHPWHDLSGAYNISKEAEKIAPEKIMAVYEFIYSTKTRTKMYENNIRISCMKDVLEKADDSKLIPQFKEFAELYDEDYKVTRKTSFVVEGDNLAELWQKIWVGQIDIDSALQDYNRRASEGFAKAVADGKIDPEEYKD